MHMQQQQQAQQHPPQHAGQYSATSQQQYYANGGTSAVGTNPNGGGTTSATGGNNHHHTTNSGQGHLSCHYPLPNGVNLTQQQLLQQQQQQYQQYQQQTFAHSSISPSSSSMLPPYRLAAYLEQTKKELEANHFYDGREPEAVLPPGSPAVPTGYPTFYLSPPPPQPAVTPLLMNHSPNSMPYTSTSSQSTPQQHPFYHNQNNNNTSNHSNNNNNYHTTPPPSPRRSQGYPQQHNLIPSPNAYNSLQQQLTRSPSPQNSPSVSSSASWPYARDKPTQSPPVQATSPTHTTTERRLTKNDVVIKTEIDGQDDNGTASQDPKCTSKRKYTFKYHMSLSPEMQNIASAAEPQKVCFCLLLSFNIMSNASNTLISTETKSVARDRKDLHQLWD